jgi:hypothetical protein
MGTGLKPLYKWLPAAFSWLVLLLSAIGGLNNRRHLGSRETNSWQNTKYASALGFSVSDCKKNTSLSFANELVSGIL